MIVNLTRVEGIMPRSEQIPGEQHNPGERVQALILEVRDTPSAVKIILSRSHPELIRRLFEREVPEVGERTIEIKALAREPGHRTKIAVSSIDSKVDAVGACVGVRGSRIKNIVDELGGEKIDIVRWNESSQILISNALKPAEVAEVSLCFELGRATVVVNEDQLSLAIGKRGQNVRLAARLTGWDIDILTPVEFQNGVTRLDSTLKSIEGITQEHVDKVIALGLIDVRDIEEVGTGPLMEELGLDEQTANRVVERCAEEAKIVAVEQEEKKRAEAAAKAAAQAGGGSLLGGTIKPTDDQLSRGVDAVAFANPLLQQVPLSEDSAQEEPAGSPGNLAGAMEAVEGLAPEITTHSANSLASGAELSPEEQAIQGLPEAPQDAQEEQAKEITDEDAESAALAEGRVEPPATSSNEPSGLQ
jgi:N utilization substance protein A